MKVSELKVTGLHNAANALAALALCRAIGLAYEPLLDALFRFSGLPHRVQRVAEINGVAFFDDSKGTNVGATVAALEGMGRKVVLIAGGDGKGQDFSPLRDAVARQARAVVLIGRDRDRIAAAIESTGVVLVRATDMHEAVRASSCTGACRAMPCCCRRRAPASTCFATTSIVRTVFVDEVKALEGAQ